MDNSISLFVASLQITEKDSGVAYCLYNLHYYCFLQYTERAALVMHFTCMCLCVQLNVIPVMFCSASGAVGWHGGGDVAVCEAGLTNISLPRL